MCVFVCECVYLLKSGGISDPRTYVHVLCLSTQTFEMHPRKPTHESMTIDRTCSLSLISTDRGPGFTSFGRAREPWSARSSIDMYNNHVGKRFMK